MSLRLFVCLWIIVFVSLFVLFVCCVSILGVVLFVVIFVAVVFS